MVKKGVEKKITDWIVALIPFEGDPDDIEIIEVLANPPLNWKKFLKELANKTKKKGRYLVFSAHYDMDAYYPQNLKKKYKKVLKKSGC